MDKVIINKLTVRAIIGIDPQERKKPQRILVTVIAFTNERKTGTPDKFVRVCVE